MSVFSHASITHHDGTATVRLTFISAKVAEKYSALSHSAWTHQTSTDRHVTRVAPDYAGFRAYRDAFCLTFQTPDAARSWLTGQEETLWVEDKREPDDGEPSAVGDRSVSLRNGITYEDLGMRKQAAEAESYGTVYKARWRVTTRREMRS